MLADQDHVVHSFWSGNAGADECGPKPVDTEMFINTRRQAYLVRAEIAEGEYLPVLSAGTKKCHSSLPWWTSASQSDRMVTATARVRHMIQ